MKLIAILLISGTLGVLTANYLQPNSATVLSSKQSAESDGSNQYVYPTEHSVASCHEIALARRTAEVCVDGGSADGRSYTSCSSFGLGFNVGPISPSGEVNWCNDGSLQICGGATVGTKKGNVEGGTGYCINPGTGMVSRFKELGMSSGFDLGAAQYQKSIKYRQSHKIGTLKEMFEAGMQFFDDEVETQTQELHTPQKAVPSRPKQQKQPGGTVPPKILDAPSTPLT